MRKLATAAIAFSAAVFVSNYFVPQEYNPVCAAALALLSLSALFLKGDNRVRLLLVALSAAVGFSVCYASYVQKTLPARELNDTEQTISARVTDYPEIHENYSSIRIMLTGEGLPKLSAELYSFEGGFNELAPGDLVTATVKVKTADERYGEAFSGSNAENVYLLCYLNGELEVKGRSEFSFIYFPKTLAKNIKEISAQVFADDSAPLMTALLTGDSTRLNEDTALYADMSAAGILHVVAVSGMNVAFLVGFIQVIVPRKKLASLISIPVVWLFVPFAGASPSVIRAAFMISMVLTAPLIHRENDGVTSLTAVLAALFLINPAACASVSLQLSFAAMLGMLLITPKIYKPLNKKVDLLFSNKKTKASIPKIAAGKFLLGVSAAFASTIGAIVFTTPIAALYFGYVSLIGILVNVLVFWAVSVCFILGYISCIAGFVALPLGVVLGTLTSLFVRYIITVTELAASVPYAAIYTKGNIFGYWLVLVYVIFILCYAFRRKEGFRPVLPVSLAVTSLCCVIIFTQLGASTQTGSFTAVDVGQGQSIIMSCGEATIVIDCGGKGKNSNAGDTVAGLLLGSGRQTVDVLALTHFDEDHVNCVLRLMSRVYVKRLVIPDGSYDKTAREEILTLAEEKGTEVYTINRDTTLKAEELRLIVYPMEGEESPELMFLGCIGDFEALISGDAYAEEEQQLLAAHELPDAELFVAGHHGSKYSSCEELLSALNAEYAVVSCGYNSYGHPTQEALGRFESAGMEILRTDYMGNITLRIGG